MKGMEAMNANLLICCVDNGFYAKCLEQSLPVWKRSAETVTVVTDFQDHATVDVCRRFGAICHQTNIFYQDGRIFGKSAALEEARQQAMLYDDWVILADADIHPPDNWLDLVKAQAPQIGNLYGCQRMLDGGKVVAPKGEVAGYFAMFHTDDPYAQGTPLLNPDWIHAGNYDSEFSFRWPAANRIILPVVVKHSGPDGENWMGRGNHEAMLAMRVQRQKGRNWRTEKISRV